MKLTVSCFDLNCSIVENISTHLADILVLFCQLEKNSKFDLLRAYSFEKSF